MESKHENNVKTKQYGTRYFTKRGIIMHDLIEMTYKCRITPIIYCEKCKYYNECILSEILDVHTGNAPPIIDYPTPTQIIYADGEWKWKG